MDEQYMRLALDLAQKAMGKTSPNPMVGALIVKNGTIIGQGWHKQAGTPHAEIHALNEAGYAANGATMYVTLEPCSHYGRTGPCVDKIIAAGIRKVVVAMIDPNPVVAGNGIKKLREAGIEVIEGILATDSAKLNEIFIKWISTRRPFIALKTAMTFDGKIATQSGHSKWITGEPARYRVQRLRSRYDAILAGIGTILADDPELTVRLPDSGKNPWRIVVDSLARIPVSAKVINDQKAPTLIAVGPAAPKDKIQMLRAKNIDVITVDKVATGLNLRQLVTELGAREITSIFVEGGPTVNASLLADNLIDKLYWFIAPKIIGGVGSPGPVGGQGISHLREAIKLEDISIETVADDLLISAYLADREGRDVYRNCGRIGRN